MPIFENPQTGERRRPAPGSKLERSLYADPAFKPLPDPDDETPVFVHAYERHSPRTRRPRPRAQTSPSPAPAAEPSDPEE